MLRPLEIRKGGGYLHRGLGPWQSGLPGPGLRRPPGGEPRAHPLRHQRLRGAGTLQGPPGIGARRPGLLRVLPLSGTAKRTAGAGMQWLEQNRRQRWKQKRRMNNFRESANTR